MGCLLDRLMNTNKDITLTDDEEAPKVYSWDKRDKTDTQNYIIDSQHDTFVVRPPGSVSGQQFIIKDCKNVDIFVFDHCATVTIDDSVDCRILIGAVKTSLFVRDCVNCTIATACQQFRSRDCKKLHIFLCCTSQPIIEATTAAKFGCLQLNYRLMQDHITSAALNVYNNNWCNIYDFTPVPGENNFGLMERDVLLDQHFNLSHEEEIFHAIELETHPNKSLIPFTSGTSKCFDGVSCLVVIFWSSKQHVQAASLLNKLNEDVLIQTMSVNLTREQAKGLFSTDTYNSQVTEGPLIALEFNVQHVDVCKQAVRELQASENIRVSDDASAAKKEISYLKNLNEMLMNV